MGLEALGAIAGGINRGMDWTRRDRELDDQRKYREEDRSFLTSQRQRALDEQGRSDTLRNDLSAVPAAGEDVYGAGEEGPTKKTQTSISQARQQAAAYQKSGDSKTARELYRWADDAAAKAAGQRALSSLSSLPATATPYEILNSVAPGITDDPSPIGVRNVTKNDDGSASAELYNKTTGYSTTQTFKDAKSLQNALLAHYSPEMYNKLLERRQAAQEKIEAERAKGVVLPAGGAFIPGEGDTRKPVSNSTGYVPDPEGRLDADGRPIMVKPSAAGSGAGTGAGKGKAQPEAISQAAKMLEEQFGKPDGSPEMAQRNTRAMNMLEGIYATSPTISPRTAAYIAADATADEASGKPTKVSTRINKDTGTVDLVYRNPQVEGGAPFVVGTGSAADFESKYGRAAVEKEVSEMVADMSRSVPESSREAYKSQLTIAATDPDTRAAYLKAAKDAGKDVAAIERQLDLVKNYGPKANIQKKPAPLTNTEILKKGVGGLFGAPSSQPKVNPDSEAGRFQARQQDLRTKAEEERRAKAEEKAARQAAVAEEFKRDKESMKPEDLARKYDSRRFELSSKDAAELQQIERQIR